MGFFLYRNKRLAFFPFCFPILGLNLANGKRVEAVKLTQFMTLGDTPVTRTFALSFLSFTMLVCGGGIYNSYHPPQKSCWEMIHAQTRVRPYGSSYSTP